MKVKVSFEIEVPMNEQSDWNKYTNQIEQAIEKWFGKKKPDTYEYKVLDE